MSYSSQFHTVRGYQLLEQNKKRITSAMEDYIEMIFRHSQEDGFIKLGVLSQLLNVKASSASNMLAKIASLGLISYKRHGIVILTEGGHEIGKFLLERHIGIEKFLSNIGVTENILLETELIEHNISPSTFAKINKLNELFERCPEIIIELQKKIK